MPDSTNTPITSASYTEDVACVSDCVNPDAADVARRTVANGNLDEVAPLLSALGNLTRLRLLTALQPGPLCTCDLAVILGVSNSAVSHQLRLLKERNLVQSRRDGRIVYHELANESVRNLVATVSQTTREVAAQ